MLKLGTEAPTYVASHRGEATGVERDVALGSAGFVVVDNKIPLNHISLACLTKRYS